MSVFRLKREALVLIDEMTPGEQPFQDFSKRFLPRAFSGVQVRQGTRGRIQGSHKGIRLCGVETKLPPIGKGFVCMPQRALNTNSLTARCATAAADCGVRFASAGNPEIWFLPRLVRAGILRFVVLRDDCQTMARQVQITKSI
ncbi:MAG TPA: hypothetical protein VKU19_10700 [Bryobacteraceae bacterium]|nr:hypothetical protein [Bryobacteraceae bacterium]